jgi:hypothetical protein
MTTKKAWDHDTQNYHNREDRARVKQVATQVAQGVLMLLKKVQAKGSSMYEWAYQLGGIKGLATTTDTEIKRGYFQFRKALESFLMGLPTTDLNYFYNAYGKNPSDWSFIKVSHLRTSRLLKKRARKSYYDTGIIEIAEARHHFQTTLDHDPRNSEFDHKDDVAVELHPKQSRLFQRRAAGVQYTDAIELPVEEATGVQEAIEAEVPQQGDCPNAVHVEPPIRPTALATSILQLNKEADMEMVAGPEGDIAAEIVSDPALDYLIETFGSDDDILQRAIVDHFAPLYPGVDIEPIVSEVLDSINSEVEVLDEETNEASLTAAVDSPDPIQYEEAFVSASITKQDGPEPGNVASKKTADAPNGDVVIKLEGAKKQLLGLLHDPNTFCMVCSNVLGVEVYTDENVDLIHAYYVHNDLAEEEETYAGIRIALNPDLFEAWANMDPQDKDDLWQKWVSLMDQAITHEAVHEEQDSRGELDKDRWEKKDTDAANLMAPQEIEAHAKDAYIELQNAGYDDHQILQAIQQDDQSVLDESETVSLYREELGDTKEWFQLLRQLAQNVAS